VLAVVNDPTLLGVAAIIASCGGILTTVVGIRKTRHDERATAEEDCRNRLREARKEAEEAAHALHNLRMRELKEDR